ncbi:MAG TPA: 2-C-methyl-D-erythritol 4-phosphate cytidylyltransferase [Burkholderiaceae bacterium]
MTGPRHFALIPAAGVGARMGSSSPKQYVMIAGKPMLLHVLDTFAASPLIEHTYVVVNAEDKYIKDVMAGAPHLEGRVTVIFNGGATRHVSVRKGLSVLSDFADADDWVLVHDAARPGLTTDMIARLIQALDDDPVGGLLAMPVIDTLKRGAGDGRVQATVPRSGLWAAQTPQMFRYAMLRRALETVDDVTDESSAIEALGLQPRLVEGSARNFKVTLPQDVALAEMYLHECPASSTNENA